MDHRGLAIFSILWRIESGAWYRRLVQWQEEWLPNGIHGARSGHECLSSAWPAQARIEKAMLEGKDRAAATLDYTKFFDRFDPTFYMKILDEMGYPKGLAGMQLDMYADFVQKSNLAYEESILETKYDDFKYIMQEYKDGILLFELTDKKVWSKAVKDTAGLEAFYKANEKDYMWKERVDATIFSCKDSKIAKMASKQAKKGKSINEILEKCNAKDPLAVKVETQKFEKGSNELLDKITWSKGVYPLGNENDRVKFVRVNELIAPTVKSLEVNMGQATSDYQNHLESKWINELKQKYPVQVFEKNVIRLYQ